MEKGQNNSILSPASKSYLRKKLFTAKKASKKTRDNMEKKNNFFQLAIHS